MLIYILPASDYVKIKLLVQTVDIVFLVYIHTLTSLQVFTRASHRLAQVFNTVSTNQSDGWVSSFPVWHQVTNLLVILCGMVKWK